MRPESKIVRKRRSRRGTTMVEIAAVLPIFLTLVLGSLDVGLAVYRRDALAQAARQGARQAIVRGSMASALGAWGPTGFTVSGTSTNSMVVAMRPFLAGFDLSAVTVHASWPDGGNDPALENRVQVTVSAPYRPLPFLGFSKVTYNLQATSTMRIVH
jgi:Flp pilus assembly protein TadG